MNVEEFLQTEYHPIAESLNKKELVKGTYTDNWTRNTVPWNKLYKRELFDAVQFPEGKGYEDAYTIYRLIDIAKVIVHIDAPLYYWYDNPESYSGKKSNPQKLFFREEALRLQAEFYQDDDIRALAQRYYLDQLFFMDYQLRNDYGDSAETMRCERIMFKKLRHYFLRYRSLLSDDERVKYYEWCVPYLYAAWRKVRRK